MKKTATISLIIGITLAATVPLNAGGKGSGNARSEQARPSAEQIAVNRESNAGIGDGGERSRGGNWFATLFGEDGAEDRDPGGSEGKNQACTGDGGNWGEGTSC